MGDTRGGSIQSRSGPLRADEGTGATLRVWAWVWVDAGAPRGLRFLRLVVGVESILAIALSVSRNVIYLMRSGAEGKWGESRDIELRGRHVEI
jgi:hypothetical protein